MHQIKSCFIPTQTQLTLKLKTGKPLLGGRKKHECRQPGVQRQFALFHDGPAFQGSSSPANATLKEFPPTEPIMFGGILTGFTPDSRLLSKRLDKRFAAFFVGKMLDKID